MAPSQSTTLRVPIELRDEIARIADQRGSSLVEVVADAIQRLQRDEWWSRLHVELDSMPEASAGSYAEEAARLDESASDGLNG